MSQSLVRQSSAADLTSSDVAEFLRELDSYDGYWRPVFTSEPNPISHTAGIWWLYFCWTGVSQSSFIPPMAVVRDSLFYHIMVLDPFAFCGRGAFEEMRCHDVSEAKVALHRGFDRLREMAVVSCWAQKKTGLMAELSGQNWTTKSSERSRVFKHGAALLRRIKVLIRASSIRRVIALSTALSLFSIGGMSNVWAFAGEACGRYAYNYEDLRWCQTLLELGAMEEVVTRTGTLRYSSGRDWYLDQTDLEGETLWVDVQRLSDERKSRLFSQCGDVPCRVNLTGMSRDRMISITSFDILSMPH